MDLQRIQRVEAAHHHHHEVLGVQIAEVEPVGPSLPKLFVELSHLRDGINLSWIIVIAFDHEGQAVHHSLELLAQRNTKLAKPK
jgi:hypothetical protein